MPLLMTKPLKKWLQDYISRITSGGTGNIAPMPGAPGGVFHPASSSPAPTFGVAPGTTSDIAPITGLPGMRNPVLMGNYNSSILERLRKKNKNIF